MKKIITTISRNHWSEQTEGTRITIAEFATANAMHVYLKTSGPNAAFLYFVARNPIEAKAFRDTLENEDVIFTRPGTLPAPSKICTIPLKNLYPDPQTPSNNAAASVPDVIEQPAEFKSILAALVEKNSLAITLKTLAEICVDNRDAANDLKMRDAWDTAAERVFRTYAEQIRKPGY